MTKHQVTAVLLAGMSRSGTTWIGKIMDSCPDVLYLHEPDSSTPIRFVPLLPEHHDHRAWTPFLEEYVEGLHRQADGRALGKLPSFPKSYGGDFGRRVEVGRTKVSSWLRISTTRVDLTAQSWSGHTHLVWKSIESLGRIGTLAEAVPNLHIFHLARHPCGFVSSVLRGEAKGVLGAGVPTSEDFGVFHQVCHSELGQDLGLTLSRFSGMPKYERLAWVWAVFNEKAYLEHSMGAKSLLIYDQICQAPREEMRRVFEAAGMQWSDSTERFLTASTSSTSTGYFSVKRDPIAAAQSWRRELTGQQAAQIMEIAARTRVGRDLLDSV